MDRRYQVFVSSTFEDLEEARREVSSSLLKSDCFPAGMELFPAADLEQFDYIKQIISDCDYFIIMSAGKYGSIHPTTGLSYTEMEYDYAASIGKPTIRLLHKNPFTILPGKALESTDKGRKKLRTLREKLTKSRVVNFWDDIKGLGQQTILALVDIKKRNPTPGWVRGDNAMSIELMKEVEMLRAAVSKNSSSEKAEQLVNFEDLTAETNVSIVVSSKDGEEDGIIAGFAEIKNKEIAAAVFISLISQTGTLAICREASDILTSTYPFPKKYHKYKYFWLQIPYEKTEHFLHYLESRGLVRGIASSIASNWQLTQRGRRHATYMSSIRNLK